MAEETEAATGDGDGEEDEDVVWEGSPLHQHLKSQGVAEDMEVASNRATTTAAARASPGRMRRRVGPPPPPSSKGLCARWPREAAVAAQLEVEVAKRLMDSELLVQEDEDFVGNFILTEEALELARKSQKELEDLSTSSSSSKLSDALLISGSLAAAAATVLYLSERTRLAATMASVLPTALAAATAATGWAKGDKEGGGSERYKEALMEKEQFEKLVETLLTDMKMFKQLVRKSLNLLQGMELMQSGYVFAVSSSTGGPVTTSNGSGDAEEGASSSSSGLRKAMDERACFPALRKATYNSTVELIRAYRQSVERLMEVSPLADHVDFKEHYIAFVDMKEFGIDGDEGKDDDGDKSKSANVSVKELKDTVQLGLVQQSEYLRRFALSFSDGARDDGQELDRAGLLKQVRDLVGTLKKINSRLSRVFEYHQAMGVVPEKRQRSLVFRRHQTVDLIPLRSVHTSLFSTGLHLQNSLLKVRKLERAFDRIEKRKTRETDMLASLIPSDDNLADWLASFETIQRELNACVGCLDEGMSSIGVLKHAEDDGEEANRTSDGVAKEQEETEDLPPPPPPMTTMSEGTSTEGADEFFEAVTTREAGEQTEDEEDEGARMGDAERMKMRLMTEQSERLLRELRTVLVGRAENMEAREEAARAARGNEIAKDCQKSDGGGLVRAEPATVVPEEADNDDGSAFRMNTEEKEVGRASTNDFEDSFADYLRIVPPEVSQDLTSPVDDDSAEAAVRGRHSPSSTTSSSSSSEQATVKSVSSDGESGRPPAKDSSSSYDEDSDGEEEDDEDGKTVSAVKKDGDAVAGVASARRKRASSKLKKRSPSIDSIHDSAPADRREGAGDASNHSLSELRSISSPDIKKLLSEETSSSPYESLEKLPPRLKLAAAVSNGGKKFRDSLESSSDSEDYDDEGAAGGDGDAGGSGRGPSRRRHQVLKTYRRPLRPAVLKKEASAEEEAARRKSKRDRNMTVGMRSDGSLEKEDGGGDRNGHAGSPAASANGSSYAAKKNTRDDPLFLPPTRPLGFDAAVAMQAARKAVSGFNGMAAAATARVGGVGGVGAKEEVFGDSESDEDS